MEGLNADGRDSSKAVGAVIGLDKATSIAPLKGAVFLNCADITAKETKDRVLKALSGAPLDLLLVRLNFTLVLSHFISTVSPVA